MIHVVPLITTCVNANRLARNLSDVALYPLIELSFISVLIFFCFLSVCVCVCVCGVSLIIILRYAYEKSVYGFGF